MKKVLQFRQQKRQMSFNETFVFIYVFISIRL